MTFFPLTTSPAKFFLFYNANFSLVLHALFKVLHLTQVTLNRNSWNSVLHCIKNTNVSIHSIGINMACEIQFYICPVILILSVFAPPYTDPFLCMTGYNTIKITGVNLGRVKEQRKFINYFLNNIHFYQHNIIFASKIVSSCNLLQHHTTSNILLSSVNIIKLHQWQRLEKKSLWATLMKSQKNWTTFRIMKTDKEIICKFFLPSILYQIN